MIKRIVALAIIFLALNQNVFAKDISVEVGTLSKISTANVKLQEGDNLNLVVVSDVYKNNKLFIKKGAAVTGVITKLVNNGFTCQEASIYAENFRTKDINGENIKLKGIIFKKGRDHWMLTQFLPVVYVFIRGGEAAIVPNVDVYTLYIGGLNE